MQKKTKLEIINETVAFYSEDVKRRAADAFGVCEYKTADNRKCAVGRVLLAKAFREDLDGHDALDILIIYGDSLFKNNYRGHAPAFWNDLQFLHDRREYWNGEGLTAAGVTFKTQLLMRWVTNEL